MLRDRLAFGAQRLGEVSGFLRYANVPIYMVHNSGDAEDYFFLVDFEQFIARSKKNWLVRPSVKIWAGRSDFNRRRFARQFREVFAREFDQMRAELSKQSSSRSFVKFDFGYNALSPVAGLASVAVNMVLLTGLIPKSRRQTRRRHLALEDEIEDIQTRVEDALSRVDISQHITLYNHAYRGHPKGPLSGLDYAAWPLPQYVAEHLNDTSSSSWW